MYLNQKSFLSHIEKKNSWEHRVYILMDFKSNIEKT